MVLLAPYLAAVAGALLMWASFPPLGWGFLGFVAPVPFLWALRRVESGGAALLIGFLFGGFFFGGMLWWIFVLGAVAWMPLTFWLAFITSGYALAVWAFRLWPDGRWWVITVAGWGLWEFIRARFPFGGFPWGSLGYAAGGSPGAIGAVQWIGPSGWSILAVAVSAGLVLFIEDRSKWRLVVDPGVVALMLILAGSLFAPRADGEALRVAIVQGGSPCPMTRCQNENLRIYERHLDATRTIPAGSVDLVVWPENSTGSPYEPSNPEVRDAIVAEGARIGAFMFISGTRSVPPDEFLNVNMVFAPQGEKLGEYAKRHPVPFGEYVPLRGLLDFIPQLERVPRDMLRGVEPVVFRLPQGVIGSVISFEGAFDRSVRSEATAGADLMVVATNESSYGDHVPASDQLIGMTRVNAAAVGQDLIHAAITGKSTFITAAGEVGETTAMGQETVLYGEARFRSAGPTLFTRFGDWVLYIALVGGAMAIALPSEGRTEARRAMKVAS